MTLETPPGAADSGTGPGPSDSGPGADTGVAPGADTGVAPGADTGVAPGADTGVAPGADAGFGPDASPPRDGGGGPVGFDAFARESISAYCWQIAHCPIADDDAIGNQLLFTPPSAVSCERYLESVWRLEPTSAAIAAGRARFDPAAARRCLDVLGSSCAGFDRSRALVGDCRAALQGLQPIGGPCSITSECGDDGRCELAAGAGCGTCRARAALGAACQSDVECTERAAGGGGGWCLGNRCVEVNGATSAAVGLPCGLTSVVQNRVTYTSCAAELFCSTSSRDEMGFCLAPIAPNLACGGGDTPCMGLNVCGDAPGGSVCSPVTVRTQPGQSCDERTYVVCNPLLRLRCASGLCVSIGDGTEGAACRTSDFSNLDCNPGLYCDRTLTRCARTKPDGATCTESGECTTRTCARVTAAAPMICGIPACF